MSDRILEEEVYVPKLPEFREAVDEISNVRDSVLIKTLYLAAARVCEVSTKISPWDIQHGKRKPYGSYLSWTLEDFKKEKVLLLKPAVAKRKKTVKRKGKIVQLIVYKMVGLPCNPAYEPWTLDLLKWIEKHENVNFALTPQWIGKIWKRRLPQFFNQQEETPRILNPLRHYRITHLIDEYNFDPYDITAYTGWKYQTTFGRMGMSSGQLDFYAHLSWRRYFPKLLKKVRV